MLKIFSKTAFSLLELIIASALVIFVILGMFAVNSVLNNNNQDYGQRYLVKSETQTTLNNILNNASLAVGSGTSDNWGNPDTGILIGTVDPYTICIHQDLNNTPGNYVGTTWLCYTWHFPGQDNYSYQIFSCTFNWQAATGNPSNRGAASCNASANAPGTYVGTSYNDPANTNPNNPPITTFTSNTFNITIENCLNNSTCGGANSPSNPLVSITGSASPPQEGGT